MVSSGKEAPPFLLFLTLVDEATSTTGTWPPELNLTHSVLLSKGTDISPRSLSTIYKSASLRGFTITYRIVLLRSAAVSFSFLPFLLLVDVVVLDLARLFALFVSLLLGLEGLLVRLTTRMNNMQYKQYSSASS